jgi:hypothetical protein
MSLEQYAFLKRDDVPTVSEWQSAIDEIGFDFKLDPELKPHEDSGFLPCILEGKESGFEIYYETANETLKIFPQLKDKIESRDYVISFRWGGDMAECASVLIASIALSKFFNAIIYYANDDMFYTTEELITEANVALSEVNKSHDNIEDSQPDVIHKKNKKWWEFWKQ